MTREGLVQHWSYLGYTDGPWYARFLKDLAALLVARDHLDGRESICLFDNATYHKTDLCQEVAEEGGLRVLCNCAYCPEFNMAEQFIRANKALISEALRQDR